MPFMGNKSMVKEFRANPDQYEMNDKAIYFCTIHLEAVNFLARYPKEDQQLKKKVWSFFLGLTLYNNWHPKKFPYSFVIPCFFEAIEYGHTDMPANHTVRAYLDVFKKWVHHAKLFERFVAKYGFDKYEQLNQTTNELD